MLYIRLKNGQPFEHPITESNLLLAYADIDLNNLPSYVVPFISSTKPSSNIYQVVEESYSLENNVVKQNWIVRDMTPEEKLVKQELAKNTAINKDDNSLVFDLDTCQFIPPIPYPTDGKTYEWNSSSSDWIEIIPD